jgi:nitroreductase
MSVELIAQKASEPASGGQAQARSRYETLLEVLRLRRTARAFDPTEPMPDETYRLILEAARLAPSGANAQPWSFVVVASSWTRHVIAHALADAQAAGAQAGAGGGIDYRAIETAAGCMVVVTDFRLTWAFPGLMQGTELDQRYHANAERIILQSVAAATTAAHLAAAALGFQSWWISLLGREEIQATVKEMLEIPADLTVTDIMLFGSAAGPVKSRWKKEVADIVGWDRFNMENFRSLAQIDAWMKDLAGRFRRGRIE